jgi:hypothetical protein
VLLKALRPGFEDKIATVCSQLVLKTCQRINGSLKLHAKRFKLRYSRNFGYAFNTISLNSTMNIGEMEQPHTGVTLPHHIAEAGSWRKQMMIFVC